MLGNQKIIFCSILSAIIVHDDELIPLNTRRASSPYQRTNRALSVDQVVRARGGCSTYYHVFCHVLWFFIPVRKTCRDVIKGIELSQGSEVKGQSHWDQEGRPGPGG